MDGTRRVVCDVCKAIPFHNLPSEEEPGFPHQSSLLALKASALACPLCFLILNAAQEVRKSIRSQHGDHDEGRVPEWREFVSITTPSGKAISQVTTLGSFAPGTTMITETKGPREGRPGSNKPEYVFKDDASVQPWLYGNWWEMENHDRPLQLLGLGVRLGVNAGIHSGEGNTSDQVWLRGSHLRIRTDDEAYMARFIPGRLRAVDSASTIAMKRVQSWIQLCEWQHRCTVFEAILPSRVLDLGQSSSSNVIKIVETHGRRGGYVTLSHCWGVLHGATTTSSNLEARKHAISISDLPKTFQDAIFITRQLRIQYLWIDSLCILQDSHLDWERESSKMATVYANSYLTIAATSSRGDSNGCFPSNLERSASHVVPELSSLGRNDTGNTSALVHTNPSGPGYQYFAQRPFVFLDIPFHQLVSRLYLSNEWLPASRKSSPRLYQIGAFGRPFDPIASQHLCSRGWTLQERLLSPRTVHYAADQIYWECKKCLLGEDGSRFQGNKFGIDAVIEGQKLPLSKCGLSKSGLSLIEGFPAGSSEGHGRWRDGWLSHVQAYSRRNLSYEADKLPALSGLANLIASQTEDDYHAGLWRKYILEDLHWRVYARQEYRVQIPGGFEHRYGEKLCDVKVPTHYRAPSWSWASLDAHISFVPLDFDRVVAECLDCHTIPTGNDPYGKVSSGWIKLRAPLIEIHMADPNYKPDKQLPLGLGVLVELHLDHGVSMGNAFFDTGSHFPCFALFFDSSNALILTPNARNADDYVRIGIANFLRTDHQRSTRPMYSESTGTVRVPYGPITVDDARVIVTVI